MQQYRFWWLRAWKEVVVWGGIQEDAPVLDAEVRSLIKELHEVQEEILPEGVKYKKVTGTPNSAAEKFAVTGLSQGPTS